MTNILSDGFQVPGKVEIYFLREDFPAGSRASVPIQANWRGELLKTTLFNFCKIGFNIVDVEAKIIVGKPV